MQKKLDARKSGSNSRGSHGSLSSRRVTAVPSQDTHLSEEVENKPSGETTLSIQKSHTSRVEDVQHDAFAAQKRMVQYEVKQKQMRDEETDAKIDSLLDEGLITEDEAQERRARQHMHRGASINQHKNTVQLDGLVMAAANIQTTEMVLEEILTRQSKNYCVRKFKEITGIAWIDKKARLEEQRRSKSSFVHCCPLLHRYVSSRLFEATVGAVLIFNCITIGFEVSEDLRWDKSTLEILEHSVTGLFTLEIILRVASDGWIWLWDMQNGADVALVFATGVFPLWIFKPLHVQIGENRTLQIVRALRLARLVRMFRKLKMLRVLWKLVQGLSDSLFLMIWMTILIGFLLYTIGLFAIYWIAKDEHLVQNEVAQEYFGNMQKAILSLFQTATLDGWSFMARPLMTASPSGARGIFLIFCSVIMFCTLMLLNLCTAVIVKNTFKRQEEDDECNAIDKRLEAASHIQLLEEMFQQMDEDQNGMLTKEEYDVAVQCNDLVRQTFSILDVGTAEADEIWELMDTGDGEVSVDQFAQTLRSLHGEAKAKDTFTIVREVHRVNKDISKLSRYLSHRLELLGDVRRECVELHRQLGSAMLEMVEFVSYMGFCIPSGTVERKKSDIEALQQEVAKRSKLIEVELQRDWDQRQFERRLSSRRSRMSSQKRSSRSSRGSASPETRM